MEQVVNICPKCGRLLKDSKFCDTCGYVISDDNEIQEYEKCCLEVKCYKIKSKVKCEDFISNEANIENPKFVDEDNNLIYFVDKEGSKSLHEYIGNRRLKLEEINKISKRLMEIFIDIEEAGLIISAINLEDFWLIDNNIESMK